MLLRQVDTFLSMASLLPGEWSWVGERLKSNTSTQTVTCPLRLKLSLSFLKFIDRSQTYEYSNY